MSATPDLKQEPRVRDPELLRVLHLVWRECCLCGEVDPLSLHHFSKHPRDDVRENLCMLCGSGTTGCHGLIEDHDEEKTRALGLYVVTARADTIAYLVRRKEGETQAAEWMRQNLLIAS